jgi:hypothetical protein
MDSPDVSLNWRILTVHGRSECGVRNVIPSIDVAATLADAPNCIVRPLSV